MLLSARTSGVIWLAYSIHGKKRKKRKKSIGSQETDFAVYATNNSNKSDNMKYIDAERLRAEIKRRKEEYKEDRYMSDYRGQIAYYKDEIYDDLLSFLDTLGAETSYDTLQYNPSPSVDIGDVARVQFASHAKVFDKKRKAVFDWEQFKEVASIFYGFGKKDSQEIKEKEQPTMGYDEAYLNEKITKASKSWEGVDVDKFMDDVRGREEPVSDCHDLEEAAEEWCKTNNKGIALCADKKSHYLAEGIDAFKAGAEWQKKQIPMPEDTVIFQKGVEEGKRLMMEGAVEGEIQMTYSGMLCAKSLKCLDGEKHKFGDKVRIIIVKED